MAITDKYFLLLVAAQIVICCVGRRQLNNKQNINESATKASLWHSIFDIWSQQISIFGKGL
jgi:hypothetical protein